MRYLCAMTVAASAVPAKPPNNLVGLALLAAFTGLGVALALTRLLGGLAGTADAVTVMAHR